MRKRLDLARLDRVAPGARLDVTWIADATSPQLVRTITGHTGWVYAVAWSPDTTRIATASSDRTVRVWDPTTGTELHTLTGHTGVVNAVAWSPDGTRIATAGNDRTVRVWDLPAP